MVSKLTQERLTRFDRIVIRINAILLGLSLFIFLIPIINVLSNSFSDAQAVMSGHVTLLPVDFTLESYSKAFSNKDVLTGYYNSIFYTTVGTIINLSVTIAAAYPLSRKVFYGRGFFMAIFTFTMFFSGGMIPSYLLIKNLGLLDTRLSMLLPVALNVMNMIIARTFFQSSIPNDLYDCASLDGASDMQVLFRVVLPLSKPILAVLTLYYAVAHWNSFFNGLIYLDSGKLFPLQLILREYLFAGVDSMELTDNEQFMKALAEKEVLKYSLIVVGSLPVIILYPFIQKYFNKGIMIGSLKG